MDRLLVIAPLTDEMRTMLTPHFSLHPVTEMDQPTDWLDTHGAGIEYVLTDGHLGLRPEYLQRLPDLKLISSNGVGYDAIDTATAAERGIVVTHTPGVLNAEVATTTLMLLMACFRNLRAEMENAHSGAWGTGVALPLSRSLDNRTIGILGMGRIGGEIARKLAPFSPRILYHSRSPKDVPYEYMASLRDMAAASDALVCITPGGAATHHLVNAEVLRALGPDGTLVNVGRGSVVDEQALIAALNAGELGYAGLDVFEDEPNIPEALRSHPRVTALPHIGSATLETRAAMGKLAIDNILQHKSDGRTLTSVPETAHLTQTA